MSKATRRNLPVTPAGELKDYQLIIRSIHQRGEDQDSCLAELDRRRLWLTEQQKVAAGLASWWPRRTT